MANTPYSPLTDGPKSDLDIFTVAPSCDDLVSICVVSRNRPEYLNLCLQSIACCSTNNNYEIIVCDQNSDRVDYLDYLSELESSGQVKVVRSKENGYFPKGANQAFKACSPNSQYIIFMHDDCVVLSPSFIDYLINISDASKSGLIGLSKGGFTIDKTRAEYIEDWCFMVTRSCYIDCGGFDETLPILGSPFLFTLAASQSGYSPQFINMPLVHHYQNFSIDINEYEKEQLRVQELLPKKMSEVQQKASAKMAKKVS